MLVAARVVGKSLEAYPSTRVVPGVWSTTGETNFRKVLHGKRKKIIPTLSAGWAASDAGGGISFLDGNGYKEAR